MGSAISPGDCISGSTTSSFGVEHMFLLLALGTNGFSNSPHSLSVSKFSRFLKLPADSAENGSRHKKLNDTVYILLGLTGLEAITIY